MSTTDTDYREVLATQDEYMILKALLDAEDEFVSGSLLAEQLGLSRPAIWGKLKKLREHGFEFEAVRNRGYRITKEAQILHPALIRYYLEQLSTEMDLLYFPAIDSTNSEAERQISYGRKSPFAIASSCQTKGRGRLGREWYSASADNLYLSVLFEPNIAPQQLQHFTLWAGIYICRALQEFVPNTPLKIKWPNDLHCDGRKFAGMLTEAKMDSDSMRSIVFGIGINLNSNPANFPQELRSIATSLYAIHGEEMPLNLVTAKVLQAIKGAYDDCIRNKTTESLPEAWAPLSALCGKPVTALRGDVIISGIANGIDETGALLLKSTDGTIHAIRAGDVTLQK
jgi:BirA family transcriptional regulator, biotin operon repressor / biotin---[acetyl-CoA-carboxylase] ligase